MQTFLCFVFVTGQFIFFLFKPRAKCPIILKLKRKQVKETCLEMHESGERPVTNISTLPKHFFVGKISNQGKILLQFQGKDWSKVSCDFAELLDLANRSSCLGRVRVQPEEQACYFIFM